VQYPTIGYVGIPLCSTLATVQRLFSMFPPGLPGLALLLLRASVAIALLLDAYGHREALPGWAHVAVILISLVVSVGYLTPIVAAAALACHAFMWLAAGADLSAAVTALVFALDAMALALLGPGAYSLDSRRFGRRLVVLPPA
jgi:uncharacterized membrane protein YphA (DoxX/SURF4 family)